MGTKMKKLIACYKAFRGGEWFDCSLRSIADYVDGVVVVLSTTAWIDSGLSNNCIDVAKQWVKRQPDWIHTVWLDAVNQEDQYELGLKAIRDIYGEDVAVLVIDTDEVWESHSLNWLKHEIDQNPDVHYFCSRIKTYLRSPFYQVYPEESGRPVVALQSACEQPLAGRFQRRELGPTKICENVVFHHFPYVRADENEIAEKFRLTSSQETIPSRADWLVKVWPRLPLGTDMHLTPGFESCWREKKRLSRMTDPGAPYCADFIIQKENERWRRVIESEPPGTTVIPIPTDGDARKYLREFRVITNGMDLALIRKRLKMTYWEAIVLSNFVTNFVSPRGKILEIGSGCGGSLAIMAMAASTAELWAIDPFEPYDEETHAGVVRGANEGNRAEFWETSSHYDYTNRVRQISLTSDLAALHCDDAAFDLVFIDGNHSYEVVKRDLELYWPKVRPGGILIGHDYTTRFPGVIKAVREWRRIKIANVFFGTSLFYAVKS